MESILSYEQWKELYDQYGELKGRLLSDVKTKVGVIPANTVVVVYAPMFGNLNVTVGKDIRKRALVKPDAVEYLGKKEKEFSHPNQVSYKYFLDSGKLSKLISALSELQKNSRSLDTESASEDLVGMLREQFGSGQYGEISRKIISLVSRSGGYYDQQGLPIESKETEMIDKDIDQVISELLQEGERPSTRPTKEVRDLMTALADAYDKMEMLQRQADALNAQIKPISQSIEGMEAQLLPLIEDYQNRTVRIKNLLAMVEDVAEKKSKIPQWSKWRDWVFAKFNAISADMMKEAQEMLESFKGITPASKRFTFKRESVELEEGALSRVIDWVKRMARKSWANIRSLEAALK